MHRSNRKQLVIVNSCFLLAFLGYADGGESVRFATFNVAMNRPSAGEMADELESGASSQAAKVAAIIQRVSPDVLLINELDYDEDHRAIKALLDQFLENGQLGQTPIQFPHYFAAAVNTGVGSGRDFDKDGQLDEPEDRLGYGRFPGQYGMVVLSKFPIGRVRTFRNFLWQNMPKALLPQTHGAPYYDDGDLQILPLSSKSHWDVTIQCPFGNVHFLVSHPTPPVFDGDEDRNGTRNHDEIRMFADYVDPRRSAYLIDDNGEAGGLEQDDLFVIAGDLNADPHDGQSTNDALRQLIDHPLIRSTPIPKSVGAVEAASQGGANRQHTGDPSHDTGDFNDESVGNLRIDYVLPSLNLTVENCGVFWPGKNEPGAELVDASDHRLVWVDVLVPGD